MSEYPQPAPQQPKNGLAVAALVLGILAIVGAFIPILNIGSIILGIIAAILGAIALATHKSKGMSIAGLILGIAAVIISIIVMAMAAAALNAVDDALNEEHTVVYTATVSTGEAQASWGGSNEDFTGTWTKTETKTSADLVASFTVTGDLTATDQQLTCEIQVDGEVVASESGETMVMCTGSLTGD